MILIDLTHTSQVAARTGTERAAIGLFRHLAAHKKCLPIALDNQLNAWRPLRAVEIEQLSEPAKPGADHTERGPLSSRVRSKLRGLFRRENWQPEGSTGLILPEFFFGSIGSSLKELRTHINGPSVAIFNDAFALTNPEAFDFEKVARIAPYLHELAKLDGVATVSETARTQLVEFWNWAEVKNTPPIAVIPLGSAPIPQGFERKPAIPKRVLCVGSIEERKNHLPLLNAAESLWSDGLSFELHLVGLAHPQTGAATLAAIDALKSKNRSVNYHGHIDGEPLETLWASAAFSVNASELEGFGSTISESTARGVPCICSAKNGAGEVAQKGGCVSLQEINASTLAEAMRTLLTNDAKCAALSPEAKKVPVRTWDDYARDVAQWMASVKKRG